MVDVIDFIRYSADSALTVPNQLNMRPFTINLLTTSWTALPSGRIAPGTGTPTVTSFVLYNGNPDGYVNVRYRELSLKDIALSGGVLRDVKAIIGPIVFPYNVGFAQGGIDPILFSTVSGSGTQLELNISGPNYPPGGTNFKKYSINADKNVMYRLFLSSEGH